MYTALTLKGVLYGILIEEVQKCVHAQCNVHSYYESSHEKNPSTLESHQRGKERKTNIQLKYQRIA